MSNKISGSHAAYLGDTIERSLEIIAQEADGLNEWELLSAYADGDLQPDLHLEGNYLRVEVNGYETEAKL